MKASLHSPIEEVKNVGIWIRVSTEEQARGEAPEHHLERAKMYAKAHGWNVVEVYDLAGQTGKAVRDHPEAKRMMADVKRGHINALVFSKLARLSRNLREVQDFGDFFKEHNADLVSLNEAIDTSTAGGRMFFHLLAVFAQWEREEIVERVKVRRAEARHSRKIHPEMLKEKICGSYFVESSHFQAMQPIGEEREARDKVQELPEEFEKHSLAEKHLAFSIPNVFAVKNAAGVPNSLK